MCITFVATLAIATLGAVGLFFVTGESEAGLESVLEAASPVLPIALLAAGLAAMFSALPYNDALLSIGGGDKNLRRRIRRVVVGHKNHALSENERMRAIEWARVMRVSFPLTSTGSLLNLVAIGVLQLGRLSARAGGLDQLAAILAVSTGVAVLVFVPILVVQWRRIAAFSEQGLDHRTAAPS